MTSIATMLREIVITLKEEQAYLELWFKDKSANEDVRRRIEPSLAKISEALGKLAALEKG
jgi:predicted RNA-binding protein (virulence factor B family)